MNFLLYEFVEPVTPYFLTIRVSCMVGRMFMPKYDIGTAQVYFFVIYNMLIKKDYWLPYL